MYFVIKQPFAQVEDHMHTYQSNSNCFILFYCYLLMKLLRNGSRVNIQARRDLASWESSSQLCCVRNA